MAKWQGGVDGNNTVPEVFHDESARFNISSHFYQDNSNQSLAFVNLTSSTTQDEGDRRLVRSHVMKSVQQQKQMQEYHDWQVQRVILPMPSSTSVIVPRSSALEPPGVGGFTQQDAAEPKFGTTSEDLQWDPITHSVTSQSTNALITLDSQGLRSNPVSFELGCSSPEEIQRYTSSYSQLGDEIQFHPQPIQHPFVSTNIGPSSPKNGRIDPFDTLPYLRNGRAQSLMYHYTQVLVRSMLSVAVDPDDKWFGYSVTDPALFHSTMLHSAAHNAFLLGSTDLADSAALKWEAIKLINDKLNDPVLGVSDVTIGAVAALALFENQSANIEISNIHMKGLYQMVRLRGGLQNLGLAGILRRKILWADLCNSMYSHSEPRFANFPIQESSWKSLDISPAATSIPKFEVYNTELHGIFSSLRSLSHALSGPFSRTNAAVDDIYALERRVVVLLAKTSPTMYLGFDTISVGQIYVLEHHQTTYQILLVAQIYIYLFLRDHLVPSPIFSVLVSRLSNSLYSPGENSKLGGAWQESNTDDRMNDILFWVLVLGTLAAEGRESRSRLRQSLQTLCNVLGIRTTTEFLERVKKVAWIEKKVDDKLWSLWKGTQGDR